MEWLNYHHLLYFYVVAREGTIAKAGEVLRLAQPTISGQIRSLEEAFGEKLFDRRGRTLVLTDVGRVVYEYAEEIFSLGRELQDTLRGRPSGKPMRFQVGISDVVPKLIAYRLLEPALRSEAVRLICSEDKTDVLVTELTRHALDLVITDSPLPPSSHVKAYNHLLGECGVSFFARPELAKRMKGTFPHSLEGMPLLLPTENNVLRRSLDRWLEQHRVAPNLIAEFEDSALMKVFGERGEGIFPAPRAIEAEIAKWYGVVVVGRTTEVRERFYAISVERRIKHPAVIAISEAAKERLFA